MLRLGLFCASTIMMLGSATPPPIALTYDLIFDPSVASAEIAAIAPAPPASSQPGPSTQLRTARAPRRQPDCVVRADGICAVETRSEDVPVEVAATSSPPARRVQAPPAAEPVAIAAPDTSASALKIVVSLPQQKLWVFRGDELVASTAVSTGKRGHETPVGTFRISQKNVKHRSNLYSNAPMPYMQRLTSGGIALHAGHLPGYRASHGCIRMPWSFAKKLFGLTSMGTPVEVTNEHVEIDEETLKNLA